MECNFEEFNKLNNYDFIIRSNLKTPQLGFKFNDKVYQPFNSKNKIIIPTDNFTFIKKLNVEDKIVSNIIINNYSELEQFDLPYRSSETKLTIYILFVKERRYPSNNGFFFKLNLGFISEHTMWNGSHWKVLSSENKTTLPLSPDKVIFWKKTTLKYDNSGLFV